MDLLPCFTSL